MHSRKRLRCQQCKTVPVSFSSACAPALPCSLCFRYGFSHRPGQRRHADIAQTLRLQQSSLACVTSPAPIRCTDIGMDKSLDKGADHGVMERQPSGQWHSPCPTTNGIDPPPKKRRVKTVKQCNPLLECSLRVLCVLRSFYDPFLSRLCAHLKCSL